MDGPCLATYVHAFGLFCTSHVSALLLILSKLLEYQPKSLRANVYAVLQAQGLSQIMGGAEAIRDAVHDHGIILAAHGPYTATGAGAVLGCRVQCINQEFSSFAGLVTALEHAFASQR